MSPVPGWYSDPASPARLRWWDGSTWTDQTRDHQTHSAPAPPGAPDPSGPTASTSTTSSNPPPPPGAGTPYGSTSSGSAGYGSAGYGSTGYGSTGWGPTGPTPGPGGYGVGGSGGAGDPDPAKRAWISWASIGAAIAVALAVILILSLSLLGHTPHTSSSQGLSNNTTPGQATTTTGPGAPSSTAAPTTSTTVVPPPPDSEPFTDPGGAYTIDVNTAWEPPAAQTEGIQQWYLTGVNYGGFRSNLSIVAQTTGSPTPLPLAVQSFETGLARSGAVHVTGSSNVTLADGTAATVVFFGVAVEGLSVSGEALVTTKDDHAVVITVEASSDAAPSTFQLVDPYLQTLHVN